MNNISTYQGQELPLFAKAVHWKRYFASFIKPYIKGDVLEVGAGMGSVTDYLITEEVTSWTQLEPDPALYKQLLETQQLKKYKATISVKSGTIIELDAGTKYDVIMYIDVLEHIEQDATELYKANLLLKPNGNLIVLSPAFLFLFSSFDKAIGHYKRYTKKSLSVLVPASLMCKELRYLDTMGFISSIANRFLLKQSYPTANQIKFWDTYLLPITKWVDRITFYSFGKSLLGIWRKKTDS